MLECFVRSSPVSRLANCHLTPLFIWKSSLTEQATKQKGRKEEEVRSRMSEDCLLLESSEKMTKVERFLIRINWAT